MSSYLNYIKAQFGKSKSKSAWKQVLYSFGLAVIFWLVISMTLYPNLTKDFEDLELTIDLEGTSAEANDLTLISQDVESVNVTISGKRTQIGNLKDDDCIAYAVVENVVQAGVYELAIKVKTKDGEVLSADVSPSIVTVEFDKYVSKDVLVEVSAPNVTAKDGYMLDENSPTVTPQYVTITGAQKQVDSIARFVVNVNQEKALDNYYTYHSTDSNEWTLYDSNNSEIDSKTLQFSCQDIQVDFIASMTKTLKLSYNLINTPSEGFSPKFNLSDEYIVVTSTDSSLETTDEFNVGDIDIRDVDLDYSETFDIALPSTYKNISGVEQVTISLNSDQYEEREFYNLTNVNIVNAPSNYDFTPITTNLSLKLIGSPEDIANIIESDINLKVDLTNVQITSNIVSASLTVELPDYPDVWCVGKQSVFLQVSEKSATTTTETTTTDDDTEQY